MVRWRSIWQRLKLLCLTALMWSAVYGTALARGRGAPKKPPVGGSATSWILPYFLVVFGVGLAMLFICRSSRRRDRARPESYEGGKITKEMQQQQQTGDTRVI